MELTEPFGNLKCDAMKIPAEIQSFHFANTTVQAYIPSHKWIQRQFEKEEQNSPVPYWAQVWPAAKALCEIIAMQPALVENKKVMELAAGLGLPSLLAAQFAKEVRASDYIPAAVEIMNHSVKYNKIKNMQCVVLDWNKLDKKLNPDVLLMSDVNYNPESFNVLYKVLADFIEKDTTVLLSTPQRLIAKSFMNHLQPWCREAYQIEIKHKEEIISTSVWLLQKENH